MSTIERPLTTVEDEWYTWPIRVDWLFYSRLLRLRGESRVPRMVYLDGELFLMTPSQPHEERKERLGWFIHEVVAGLRIPIRPTGSTTWRLASKDGGVEGDLTFYIASLDRIRSKAQADLRVDPPPDLAIEVVYSHDASLAMEVYRRLGIPEVWVSTERGLRILVLVGHAGAGPQYEPAERSAAFPMLSAEEIADWVYRPSPGGDETAWALELRTWVAQSLTLRRVTPRGR